MTPLFSPADPSNFSGYSNAQASQLAQTLTTSLDLDQRKITLQRIQKAVLDDVGFIPVWFSADVYAVKKSLQFPDQAPADWYAQ